jgi:ribose transport system permease protein
MTTNDKSLQESIAKKQSGVWQDIVGNQAFWITIVVILISLVMSFVSDVFISQRNLFNVTRNLAFTGILALGITPVIITAGIDLSVGSIMGLSGMVLGIVMTNGAPMWLGIVAALATAILVGLVNGTLIAYLKLSPFVVTLGMLSIARSLALVISNGKLISDFGPDNDAFLELGGGRIGFIPNPIIVTIVLALILWFLLQATPWGRYVYAIGGNEEAARLTGVPVNIIKVSTYVLSAFCAGIAAVMLVGWLGSANNAVGMGYELNAIAATVIGGTNLMGGVGTSFGAVIGAVLIEVIRNSLLLANVNTFWQGAFVGSALVLAVFIERIRNFRSNT